MPTLLTHPAVPLALGLGLGAERIPARLLAFGAVAAMLPDLDVLAFRFGIAYGDPLGHRGFTHSLAFAALLALMATLLARRLRSPRWAAGLFVFVAAASHGLLDMLTTGGKGVALFWPLAPDRLFFPWQVIRVSPIGLDRFFGPAGAATLLSELSWVWGPSAAAVLLLWLSRRGWAAAAARRQFAVGIQEG